jgi:hypothetical protein
MLRVTEITDNEIIITEDFAVKIYRTGRGVIAEVADSHSPFNGTYVLASIRAYALPMLLDKVKEIRHAQ